MNFIKAICLKLLKAYHQIWWVSIAIIILSFVLSIGCIITVHSLSWLASKISGSNLVLNPYLSSFIDAVSISTILGSMLVCVINSIVLLFRGNIKKFFGYSLFLFITFIGFIIYGFLFSTLMATPICDSIKSPQKDSYYTLIIEPMPTDVAYAILKSTTLLDLFYSVHINDILDYSEDGSLTKDPSLVFNKEGTILAVKRGGYYTDAIDLINMSNLVESIPWSENNREDLWKNRNEKIKKLLSPNKI